MQREHYDGPGCLVLDVRMPGLSGLDLQKELAAAEYTMPIIFNTGHGDIPMTVRATKAGAVDFLPKPFNDQDLLDAIHEAIEEDKRARKERAEIAHIQRRINTLTPQEYEVFTLVITGMWNKQVASELGTSEKTVKAHLAPVREKMQIVPVAKLLRFAKKVGVTLTKS